MTPDMIDAMIDAGLTREQMAALIKHELAKKEEAKLAKRASDAARQRKSRASRNVTVTTCDTLPPPSPPLVPSPEPLTQNPPISPTSPAATVAADPARQAQPEAEQGKIDYDEVHRWVAGLVGKNPVAVNLDISPIIALIRAGFSRERIELGIKAAVGAAKQPIKSWKSFDGWVRNTAAEAKPTAKPLPDFETQWANKLRRWHEKGDWPGVWGDPPGHPCCSIPEAFIAAYVSQTTREGRAA